MPTFVVPLDGSSFAERALRPAAALAARHAGGSGPGRVVLVACTWPQDPPIEARIQDRADLLRDLVDVEVRILDGADPVEGILSTLDAGDDRTLCMATHGRGGLRAALLGSTAEAVLCRVTDHASRSWAAAHVDATGTISAASPANLRSSSSVAPRRSGSWR